MRKHNQETNFGFMKHLDLNKNLGSCKIGNYYGNAEQTERMLLRIIYFKKSANEYRLPPNTKKIKLTEYKNNIVVNIQKVKK